MALALGAAAAADFDPRNISRIPETQLRNAPGPPPDNGYAIDAAVTPALVPDGGWTSFRWYGTGLVFNEEGPLEFTAYTPVTLRITDEFCPGDRFRVYDFGVEVGMTFGVPTVHRRGIGVDAAFASPEYASGIFTLDEGPHSLVVQVTDNPFGNGRAFLRVDTEYPMGTFVLDEVRSLAAPVHGEDVYRFSAAYAVGWGSNGIDLASDEIVVWYGRVLEVLPGAAFSCDGDMCVYENDGPGIRRAVITPTALAFEAGQIDLCPGSNPLVIGVWIGDDGGVRKVRCQGAMAN